MMRDASTDMGITMSFILAQQTSSPLLNWPSELWPENFPVQWLAWILLGVGLMVAGVWFWRIGRQWRKRLEPTVVSVRLGRKLGLGWGQCLLLARIAAVRQLSSPLTLMLSGNTFANHVELYLQQQSAARSRRLRQALGRIHDRLFG
jgi:hypothetical protein